ncbi:MAG: DUF6883 domain-containing protein [Microcystaceae cyanobacterium]
MNLRSRRVSGLSIKLGIALVNQQTSLYLSAIQASPEKSEFRIGKMKLPNGHLAQIGDKLERYSLNLEHPKGKHKARLFQKRLGITLTNKDILENALKKAATQEEAELYKMDQYGKHYDLKFTLCTDMGESLILSCWIIRITENFPRLTNTYPID